MTNQDINTIISEIDLTLTDPNLLKYSIYFENYQISIFGEHHNLYDYKIFIEKLKNFLQINSNKKYVIVLEMSEDTMNNIYKFTSLDSKRSISYLLAKSYKNKEFENYNNITFICGDNRSDEFQHLLDILDDNISNFSNETIQYELSDDVDDRLLDIKTIKLYWEEEKVKFEGDKYDLYKNEIDELIIELINKPLKFEDLNFLFHKLYFVWFKISDIWGLNKIKNYINSDYDIIFITGILHVFDYAYLINQIHKSNLHIIDNKYLITDYLWNYLFFDEPFYGEKFDNWYTIVKSL